MSKKNRKELVTKPSLVSEIYKALWNNSTKGFVLSLCGLGLFLIASLPQDNTDNSRSRNAEATQRYTGTVMDVFNDKEPEMRYVNPYVGYYQKFFCSGNRKSFGCDEKPLSPITATLEANGQDVEALNRKVEEMFLEQGFAGYKNPYTATREKKYTKSYSVEEIAQ